MNTVLAVILYVSFTVGFVLLTGWLKERHIIVYQRLDTIGFYAFVVLLPIGAVGALVWLLMTMDAGVMDIITTPTLLFSLGWMNEAEFDGCVTLFAFLLVASSMFLGRTLKLWEREVNRARAKRTRTG